MEGVKRGEQSGKRFGREGEPRALVARLLEEPPGFAASARPVQTCGAALKAPADVNGAAEWEHPRIPALPWLRSSPGLLPKTSPAPGESPRSGTIDSSHVRDAVEC